MNEIYLHLSNDKLWNIIGTIYWKGNAFLNANILDNSSIGRIFSSHDDIDNFVSSIKQLNGFFAVIQRKNNIIYAAVDKVRSIPLFYRLKGGDFYLSDDPYWICGKTIPDNIDKIAAAEFMLTGYVTGRDTLFPNIKQIQAGEALVLRQSSYGFRASTIQYYRYIPKDYLIRSEDEILSELDRVLVKVFERLFKVASGRTIVVPLSGGYDSRLIVAMLKRLGYDNVVAFSYGKLGNKQSEISKKVADSLGIRWEFVPYSNKDWHKWYTSEEFKKYSQMACGLSSAPHIQDWPAVWELKRRGLIPKDSLFVPGHGADILSGRVTTLVSDPLIDPIKAIFKQNYSLCESSSDRCRELFMSRIASSFDEQEQSQDKVSLFESWRVRERHSKFIINSLRVYEFWNYSWWIPFWDEEFMDFWSRISTDMKSGQKIYKIYVNNIFEKISGTNIRIASEDNHWRILLTRLARAGLKKAPFLGFALNAYRYYYLLYTYENNPLAFYGAIPKEEFIRSSVKSGNINSFLTENIIESLSLDPDIMKNISILLNEGK